MRQLIGVDVGGTKLTVVSLVDGRLGEPRTEPTSKSSSDELVEQIALAIESVRGPEAAAVGVGIPSVIDFATGRVRSSVNVPLEDIPLRQILGDRLGLPVVVDNDATAAAFAEAHEGDRLVVRNLVMFTVGTGVGGGLVLDGRVYRGATGAAAELGHTLVGMNLDEGAPPSGRFPQRGSLEALAAGPALDALGGKPGSGPAVVAAAQTGDPKARRLLDVIGERLGVGIANAINTFDPDVVVIGGGVSAAGDLLLEPARAAALRFVLPGVGTATEIRLARHGPEAGVLGAALLAGHELDRDG